MSHSSGRAVVLLLLPDKHIVTVPKKVKKRLFKNSKLFKEPSTCLSGWEISVLLWLSAPRV